MIRGVQRIAETKFSEANKTDSQMRIFIHNILLETLIIHL
jgi:hypothetical protein